VTLGIARPSQYASPLWPASREGRWQSTFSAPHVVMPMLGPTGTRLPTTSCRTDEMVTPVVTVPDGHGGKGQPDERKRRQTQGSFICGAVRTGLHPEGDDARPVIPVATDAGHDSLLCSSSLHHRSSPVCGLTSISGSLLSFAHPLEVTQHGDARTKPPLAIACRDGCRVLVALAINEGERHSRKPLRFGLASWPHHFPPRLDKRRPVPPLPHRARIFQ
jgi:hypothetical protein